MKKMKKISSIVLSVIMTVILVGCGKSTDTVKSDNGGGTIVYATAGAWNMLMPYNASESYSGIVWDQIFDRLFYISGNCEVKNRACVSYEVSEDGKTYTISLNEKSLWHDGEPVTAEDWAWTLQLISDSNISLTTRSIAAELEGTDDSGIELSENSIAVEVIDDYTFSITLKEKKDFESFWLMYNQYFYVLPKHLLEDIPSDKMMENEFWLSPLGSGPCKYEKEVVGSEITLSSFENYYLGKPEFDYLVYRVMDQSNFINSLLAGEIDLEWIFLSLEDAMSLKDKGNIQIVENEIADFLEIIVYNNASLSDNRWRQALTMAIDRNTLNEGYYLGKGQCYDNWIHPENQYLDSDAQEKYLYNFDPEAAKKLLDESGFDYNYEIKIVCNTASREKQCAVVQQNLASIGVKSTVQYLDSTTMWAGMYDGKYDICMMGYMPTTDVFTLENKFDSTIATLSNITDSKYNELYNAVNLQDTEEGKTQAVNELADYLYEQASNCNIVWKKSMVGLSNRLNNCDAFAANYYNNNTWEWKISE